MGDGETDADLEPRPNGDSLTGGDSDELLPIALLACTVEESTTYFSILDCLLAKSSAPFPRKAGISKAEPILEAEPIPGICEGTFDLGVFEFS